MCLPYSQVVWGFKYLLFLQQTVFFFFLKKNTLPGGLGEGNGSPLQCSCLENSVDRGAWQVSMGSQKVRHRLRFCACTAGGTGLSLGQGIRILYAAQPKRDF